MSNSTEYTKEISEIRDDYVMNEYENKLPYPGRFTLKDDHVFDENQSVKWNREQVIVEKQKHVDRKKEYDNESSRLSNKLHDDMVSAIVGEYGFSNEQANIIYSHAYSEKHSSMCDVFSYSSTLSELFERVLKV